MELLTRNDYYQIGRRYVLARAQRIEPSVVDTEGSDANLFVGSTSYCAHATSLQLADRIGALLLDAAEGEDLDRYAFDRYRLARKGASAAVGTETFTRPTSAAGSGTISIGTKIRTQTGIEYVLVSPASFGASALVAHADVRAVQAGKESQVGRHYLTRWVNQAAIFDQTIQPDNLEPTAGGEQVEDDDTFKARIRNFWASARRGTLGAIEYGALTVPGVTSAFAQEALTAGIPARVVELFIADSSGVASAALATRVRTALEEWRAGGIYVSIVLSVPQIVNLELALAFVANVDTVSLSSHVRDAVVQFVNQLGANRPLYRADLQTVLSRYRQSGLIPNEQTIVSPAGDLYPQVGSTLRTRLENVVVI